MYKSMSNTKQYRQIEPPESLDDFIRFFWTFSHNDKDFDYIVLPDACFDLLMDFEQGELKHIFLTGIWTKPQRVKVTKGTVLFAARFKLPAAEYLFQRELKTLLDSMTEIPEDFWGSEKINSKNFEAFTEHLSELLLSRLKSQEIDRRKIGLFDLIYKQQCYYVDELAAKTNWSSRQINRYFTRQFGFPLKKFLNMSRCFESYKGMANGDLYPSANYADQSHFIKEVKRFTNATPGHLFKNANDRFIQLTPLKKD